LYKCIPLIHSTNALSLSHYKKNSTIFSVSKTTHNHKKEENMKHSSSLAMAMVFFREKTGQESYSTARAGSHSEPSPQRRRVGTRPGSCPPRRHGAAAPGWLLAAKHTRQNPLQSALVCNVHKCFPKSDASA